MQLLYIGQQATLLAHYKRCIFCKHRFISLFALLFSFSLVSCSSSFTDISPDNQGYPETGGRAIALAGNDGSLYAISLNAGVWRGKRTESGVRRWVQSADPRYAHCIAVDDKQPTHIIVGDREGDAKEHRLNECGLWESFDGGYTFSYAWNPMEVPLTNPFNGLYCQSQVVEAVVFTPTSAVVAATTCGIARRESGTSDFIASSIPGNVGLVSNIVACPTKIWARTRSGILLVSTDDGKTFTNATTKPLPDGVAFDNYYGRGDDYSLAASDDKAVMSGCCASAGKGPENGKPANELIIYDAGKDSWSIENFFDGAGSTSTSGTYLGGRRFVRSFQTNTGTQFFFCNGQSVWKVDLAGWHILIATDGKDNPGTTLYSGTIHNDFWDFAMDKNGSVMWLATDGGIYENRMDGKNWNAAMNGYHALAVQSLDVYYDPDQTKVAFATQDNGAWSGNWPAWNFNAVAGTQDVNFSDGDPASEMLGFYYQSRNSFMLVSLDGITPSFSSDVAPISIFTDPYQPDTPGIIQFIKGIKSDPLRPLDALMIVHRPVKNNTDPTKDPGTPINPPAGLSGIEQKGNPWLLRNRNFADEPDFYRAISKGNWTKELDDLPEGTYRVLASGGHENPHYFAIVQEPNVLSSLWERKWQKDLKKEIWMKVYDGIIPLTNSCYEWEGWYGPVFVNPYDDSKIYILAPDAVKVSHRNENGNLVFKNDDVLTMLISASFTYPLKRQICSGNEFDIGEGTGQRVLGTSTLGTVSFCRDDPKRTLVSSPCAGVFYDDGNGKWRSFSNLLPRGPVWAAKMDDDKAYIGFAGRSVGMVNNIGNASLGTYFSRVSGFRPHPGGGQSVIAKLNISDGTVAANSEVSCRITGPDGKTIFWGTALKLDIQGQVLVPIYPIAPSSVAHLHFTGSEKEGLASSEFHFAF